MWLDVLLFVFAGMSLLYIGHIGFYLVGAQIYDVIRLKKQLQHWRALHEGASGYRPLVTLVVPAHNEEQVIVRTLESIERSEYRKLQVIVVDDASKDATSALVRHFQQEHPTLNLRLLHKRRNGGKGRALNDALRRYARGELVMTLDGDSVILPDTVGNAVAYFTDPSVVGVAANVQVMEEYTVLGMLQKLEHMVGYSAKKAYTLLNCEYVVGGVASTYRLDVLRQVDFYDTDTLTEDIGLSIKIINHAGNRARRIIYGADVVALTEGVATYKALFKQRFRWKYGSLQNLVKYKRLICNPGRAYSKTLTFYRLPVAVLSELLLLLGPVVWIYALYISFGNYSLSLIAGAYLTISAYVLVTIWFTERLSVWDKLRLSAVTPTVYCIFYIMDVVQLVSAFRCFVRLPRLLLQKDKTSIWVSPERIGRKVVV